MTEKYSFVDLPIKNKNNKNLKVTKIEHVEGSKTFHSDVRDHNFKKKRVKDEQD